MLIGEYHHNIDDKGRLIIPSKFREDIGDKFVATRGLDGCLFVYAMNEWEKIISKLKELPFTKKDARTFNRFFMSGATVCEFDRQGRINLPSSLINYAELKKECTIIGVNDRLEIWATDKFNSLIEDNLTAISDVAENLFEGFDIDA
ncbi:MAG: division/cell wall cluster transcriptional repressor MraZ [Bacilli bacterium]|nr:division/cell wall cluster transcriptional repressor MraZ [Bacilli bacterium]